MTTRMSRFARRVRAGGRDDRGSLAMALLFTVIATGLTALLLPMMIVQTGQLRHTTERVDAVAAAQAGLDVGLAQIRHSAGVRSKLPCAPLVGEVTAGATADPADYEVTVAYLPDNPRGHSAAWLAVNAKSCPTVVPAFALLTSVGTATGERSRTLTATYTFHNGTDNLLGGAIHNYETSNSTDRCMDAGAANPPVGSSITMRDCVPGSDQQMFGYTKDLTLVLISSKTSARPNGLCLQATPTDGALVSLQACASPAIAAQRWSLNDYSNFVGTSDGRTTNGLCIVSQTPNSVGSVAGSTLILSSSRCQQGADDNQQSYTPDASVGAGAAGEATRQLVNYAQFGRCMDVPAADPSKGVMIAYPCKQAPDPTTLLWNQLFTLPTSAGGAITMTNPNGVRYCLRSPGAVYNAGSRSPYVDIVVCPASITAGDHLGWTVNRDTGSYTTSYTIRNTDGYCLAVIDNAVNDYFAVGLKISKIQVAVCSADLDQKWNAPPSFGDGRGLADFTEK